jgi:glycosyltransferase involved in cell wall biosynthesis
MRILHVIQSIDTRGGGPIAGVVQLCEADQLIRHEVLCLDDPDSELVRTSSLTVTAVGPTGFLGYSRHLTTWLKQNARNYDFVVIHGMWRFHSFGTWLALRGSGIPYFLQTHGMLDPWFNEQYPLKRLKKAFFWPWTEYRVLRDAVAVIFTCEEERDRSRLSFKPYRCREEIISFGISPPLGDAEQLRVGFFDTYSELKDKRLLLFLSRIHEKKGCDLLIEAFAANAARDPRLHLLMVGPDQDGWAELLKANTRQLGIADRVSWTGMLTGDLKWGAYHAAEVFILPSHQENFGIVVVEALACGTPVLLSRKVQIWREIIEAGAGYAEQDDVAGTARLIARWLDNSPAENQVFSARAIACFKKLFQLTEFVAQWHALVNKSFDTKRLPDSAESPPSLLTSLPLKP